MYNKMSTKWDPISFTVKVKITYDEVLIYNQNIKKMVINKLMIFKLLYCCGLLYRC